MVQHSDIKQSYDRVAERYAEEFFDELTRKPEDCKLLEDFAGSVRDKGKVCDLGCGPGHVARYLKDRGVNIGGVDLSEEMVKIASRLNPDISFTAGNMLSLASPDSSLAGIVSLYAIIHVPRPQIVAALSEMNRVLKPGGSLLISFHDGEGELHRDEWYEKAVSLSVTLLGSDEMVEYVEAAGFEVDLVVERPPYDFEYPTRRIYIQATKIR